MAEGLGGPTLIEHGGKCSTTMKARLLLEPIGGAVSVRPTALTFAPPVAVSVVSLGKSPQVFAFAFFLFALTDFASQLISTDSDGTVYPSVQ